MIKEFYETCKARLFRGEKRIAPLKATGRVFEAVNPLKKKGAAGAANLAAGKGKMELILKVTKADGTVEIHKGK